MPSEKTQVINGDNSMNENTFQYTYSATANQEVLNIRKKYMPKEETKLEELKRLDSLVRNSGIMESLILGVGSCLVFGLGFCFVIGVIGNVMWLGILLGLVGIVGMFFAYPVNRRFYNKAKAEHTPRILELTAELTGNND